jgi:simple sugar transport system ATP-binding protein
MMTNKTLIKMIGITKKFSGVVANNNVDFDLHPSEIHSILGENGAGKTTLMNILAGMHQPDAGTIIVHDQTVSIRSPQDSLRLGIGMVYQHFTLIPNLTVIENLVLGFEEGFFLDLKRAEQRFQKISATYGLSIDPGRKIQDLSVSERQRTEILKILFHESDVLILDEPTSMLSPAETEDLFHTLKSLRNAGKSVALITHNLSEALSISDRITIMRSGKNAAELSNDMLMTMDTKTASNRILEVMFGAIPEPRARVTEKVFADEPVLELKRVEALNSQGVVGLKRISFSVAKGEIVGVTGADSEGRRLLAEVIGGQKRTTAGKLLYRDRDITHTNIAQRFELGIRYRHGPCGKCYFAKLLSTAFFSIRHSKPCQRSIFYRGPDQPFRDTGNRTRSPGQYTPDIRSRCHNCPTDSTIAQGRKPAGSCRFAHYHRHGRTFELQQPHRCLV